MGFILFFIFLLGLRISFIHFEKRLKNSNFSYHVEKLEQLDVGQGDSLLVLYRKIYQGSWRSKPELSVLSFIHQIVGAPHAGLVDVGSKHALKVEDWLKLLAERGVSRLSFVALTHADLDHAGGLEKLDPWIKIDNVFLGPQTQKKVKTLYPQLHSLLSFRDVKDIEIFTPLKASHEYRGKKKSGNQWMVSYRIPLPDQMGWYFNFGDSDFFQETRALEELLNKNSFSKKRVLKLSHHGSRHSTSRVLLKTLNPDQVWISVGLDNDYGHPSPLVMERIKKQNSATLIKRTDQMGVLRVSSKKF